MQLVHCLIEGGSYCHDKVCAQATEKVCSITVRHTVAWLKMTDSSNSSCCKCESVNVLWNSRHLHTASLLLLAVPFFKLLSSHVIWIFKKFLSVMASTVKFEHKSVTVIRLASVTAIHRCTFNMWVYKNLYRKSTRANQGIMTSFTVERFSFSSDAISTPPLPSDLQLFMLV